ncbi:hypothetical protein LCGC14_2269640 [marine sediment metagenome]|uniref:Uncharacterized protein n=1 Tax=marine sediment metagenome TaxID=412755 RepID=A0A0F9F9R6_9ZZZZ
MANSLTRDGEKACLLGGASDGSVARLATSVRLFKSTSSPNKDGTGFNEVDDGNGYTSGGHAITEANWTYDVSNAKITLADQTWTASGGQVLNVKGAYIVDAGGNVLAWWARSTPVTLDSGDDITLDDLVVQLT